MCVSDELFHACQPPTPRLLCLEVKGTMIVVHCCLRLVLLCSELVNGSGFLSAQQYFYCLMLLYDSLTTGMTHQWHSITSLKTGILSNIAVRVSIVSSLVSSHAVLWIMLPAERIFNHICCGVWNIKHHTPSHTTSQPRRLGRYVYWCTHFVKALCKV